MKSRRHPRGRVLRFEPLEDRRVLSGVTLTATADTFTNAGVGAGSAPVLDVLDRNGSAGDSVAYVRFDLSGLDLDDLTDAKLSLSKLPGTRYDIINFDRFDVFGLADLPGNTPQAWDEATLAETGPGAEYLGASDYGVDPVRLVDFNYENGAETWETLINATGGPQSISGPDLIDFLQDRADANGLVTFVTLIDAGNVRGVGFASREHADASIRPRLELEFAEEPGPDPYPVEPVVLPRQVEKLDRGVIAMRRSTNEVYVGWRLLGDDPVDVAFNLYRSTGGGSAVKVNGAPLTQTTDYVDYGANLVFDVAYSVRPVVDGVELEASEPYVLPAGSAVEQHLTIPIVAPPPMTTSDGETHVYSANDASVGDLDGDGDYEVVLKWIGSPADRSAPSPNMYLDAYELDGTRLWRIDVGPNIKTIASSFQFNVYDFDGDGRAEVIMNTSDGTVAGDGQVIGDPNALWQNPDGWVTSGPEYLSVFDGYTGELLANTPLSPARDDGVEYGDDYGHRATTFNHVVAYLDGQRPSLVVGRGLYHAIGGIYQSKTELTAWDWRDGQLSERWTFTAIEGTDSDVNEEYVGQGNHNASVGDVDGDGFDEIIWGAMAVDHDGTGLYSTGRGHGDALHVADMDPDNPGLEIFSPHESVGEYRDAGGDYRDAQTGELLYGIQATNDVGRGAAFDIDPNYPGYEFWATTADPDGGARMIYNVQEGAIYEMPSNMLINFGVWWDADPLRELLDGTTISKWRHDWAQPGRQNLVSWGNSGINSTSGLASNNGTKSNPALSADLFGDWREEVIWRRADNTALEIWSTTIPSTMRLPTLMHDSMYRQAIAWQQGYYNQPPHPSYFIGAGMGEAPRPALFFGGELAGDYNGNGVVDGADFTVWRDSLGSITNLTADGDHNGEVDMADYQVWVDNFGEVAEPPLAFAQASAAALTAPAAPVIIEEPTEEPAAKTPNDLAFALLVAEPLDDSRDASPATAETLSPTADDEALLLLADEAKLLPDSTSNRLRDRTAADDSSLDRSSYGALADRTLGDWLRKLY
ncbi:Rhamnogalacturonan endolyase YesW precursor [Pseudobythopirellula maris]|uniref:Rhamnogalacturonan endolyase YesW n=1 Tax=Pseudobythopirellula maris TaxID=2527991 RepID=A0A5C5ZX14_9BACT|nr:FG-GAP repeat protein [Pseudobythopirellula maris]TWT90853.1 Rhamnogalacturonan endolyase YesW precursor [Pseudobythopirellula maris]